MTAAEILEIVGERGLSIRLGDHGQPFLSGPEKEKTPALVDVLRLHRREIVEHVRATMPPCREFLWRGGNRYTEDPRDAEFGTGYQAGAWWWRVEGESAWLAIPGRGGEQEQPPQVSERSTP